jgi:hypothetical protein
MKHLQQFILIVLIAVQNLYGQESSKIILEPLQGSEILGLAGCSIHLVDQGSPNPVLEVDHPTRQTVQARINGKLHTLKWSPSKMRKVGGGSISGAWSSGNITVELHCETPEQTENSSFGEGTLEIRVGKQVKKYKVSANCGC